MRFSRWHPAWLQLSCSAVARRLRGRSRGSTAMPLARRSDPFSPVEGRSNAAVSVAALGRSSPRLAGLGRFPIGSLHQRQHRRRPATFGEPVRVNDVAGDVRGSGEQAPRVVIGPATPFTSCGHRGATGSRDSLREVTGRRSVLLAGGVNRRRERCPVRVDGPRSRSDVRWRRACRVAGRAQRRSACH